MRLLFSVLGIIFSCTLFGQTCFDLIACNFNETGDCIYEGTFNDCPSDLNGNVSVGAEDLLLFLADYDTLCDE